MTATFFGLEIARSGLNANQIALNVTAHNMANADTEGYTRQRINAAQILPYGSLSIYSSLSSERVGGGVRVLNIEQIRDNFLDGCLRDEASRYSNWGTRADALSFIESIFDESGKNSISDSFGAFLKAFQELSAGQGAASGASRENIKQTALALCYNLNTRYRQLVDQQKSVSNSIDASITRINDIAAGINQLNDQIFRFELTGQNANDLRDRRNLLLDELATLTDFTTEIESGTSIDGKVTVKIGDQILVDGSTSRVSQLYMDTTDGEDYIDGSGKMGVIKWKIPVDDGAGNFVMTETNSPVTITQGSVRAYLALREGGSSDLYSIPSMVEMLNTYANALAEIVNSVHEKGYTLPINGESITGIKFFDDSEPITAGNIRLTDEILSDPAYIAAASKKVIPGLPVETDTETNEGQNLNLLDLISALNGKHAGYFGSSPQSLEGYFGTIVANIGGQTSQAKLMAEGEYALFQNYLNKRQSISGVSIDEETANLTRYQRSYAASARVMTTMDQALETLLNTGIVGRV